MIFRPIWWNWSFLVADNISWHSGFKITTRNKTWSHWNKLLLEKSQIVTVCM